MKARSTSWSAKASSNGWPGEIKLETRKSGSQLDVAELAHHKFHISQPIAVSPEFERSPRMRWISTLFFVVLFVLFGQPAYGQTPKLVEAAKKEGGKVIVYTSMETFTADALQKAFQSKTGLQMEYWRGGSTEVIDRVRS